MVYLLNMVDLSMAIFNNQRVSLFELSSEQAVFQLSECVFFIAERTLLGCHQGVVSSFLLHQLTVVTSRRGIPGRAALDFFGLILQKRSVGGQKIMIFKERIGKTWKIPQHWL